MKGISKAMLRTCAGLAVAAAAVVGGAGVASAAPASPAATTTSHYGFGCNPYAREQWNLNGSNTVNAVYLGSTYSYSVTFRQYGSCLNGWLTDSYYPPSGVTGPIYGTINGNHVVFSFRYPFGSIQGTRTFNGYINRWGFVSGYWYETGSEHGSGSFYLSRSARHACPPWEWWAPYCQIFP